MDNDIPRPQLTGQERQQELSDQQIESVSGGIGGGPPGVPPRPSAPPPNRAEQFLAHLSYDVPVQEPPRLKRSHSAHF
jgi:hypothetical protein